MIYKSKSTLHIEQSGQYIGLSLKFVSIYFIISAPYTHKPHTTGNMRTVQLISSWCHIYASVKRVSIGSDNGLAPIRRQAIIETDAGILSIWLSRINFNDILNKIKKRFIHENASENNVCEIAAIFPGVGLSRDV